VIALCTLLTGGEGFQDMEFGLDHGVGHPVLIDLPHGSLWWTEGRRLYLDSFQYSGKHREGLLSENRSAAVVPSGRVRKKLWSAVRQARFRG